MCLNFTLLAVLSGAGTESAYYRRRFAGIGWTLLDTVGHFDPKGGD